MPKATNAFWEGSRRHSQFARATLLDLFSRNPHGTAPSPAAAPDGPPDAPPAGLDDGRTLWAADAVHRARNLAQLSSSLGGAGARHRFGMHADERAAQAAALSDAYDELGRPGNGHDDVPCGPLMEVIATNLIALFAGARSIALHLSTDHVTLPVEQRRALLLIASELTINALKYAFPATGGGTIWLTLTRAAGRIELSVADDGRGLATPGPAGSGTGLMTRLAALLHAEMYRTDNDPGLKASLFMTA